MKNKLLLLICIFLVLLVPIMYASLPQQENILYHYSYEESSGNISDDESPNNNNGATNVVWGKTGKIGNAVNLTGTTTRIVPSQIYNFTGRNYTFNTWAKLDVSATGYYTLTGLYDSSSNYFIFPIRQDQSGWEINHYLCSGNTHTGGNYGKTTAWQMMTITIRKTATLNVTLYINGTFVSYSTNNLGCSLPVSNVWGIGGQGNASDSYAWKGLIDESTGWNVTLTPSEIATMYSDTQDYVDAGADTTHPNWTAIPVNVSSTYNTWNGAIFTATDNVAIKGYYVNDSRFNITANGHINKTVSLGVNNYYVNVSVNDTSNNQISTIYNVNVTQASSFAYSYINGLRQNYSIMAHLNNYTDDITTNCTTTAGTSSNTSSYYVGTYPITCNYDATQNYSASSETFYLEVVEDDAPNCTNLIWYFPVNESYAFNSSGYDSYFITGLSERIGADFNTITISDLTNFELVNDSLYYYIHATSNLSIGEYPVQVTFDKNDCPIENRSWLLSIIEQQQFTNTTPTNTTGLSVGTCPNATQQYLFLFMMFAIAVILIILAEKFRLRIFGILAGFTFLMIYPFIAVCQIILTSIVAFIGIILLFYYFLAP
jgi:hypothetical protein